jgi:hypothetical protein
VVVVRELVEHVIDADGTDDAAAERELSFQIDEEVLAEIAITAAAVI